MWRLWTFCSPLSAAKSCVLNKSDFCPLQATPHSPDVGTTSFLQISSQNVTILFKCAGRMRLVMSVLYLSSYKNMPGRQNCSRQSSAHSPHFSRVEPFPLSQWGGQMCSGKQVLMLSQLCLEPGLSPVQHQGCRGRFSLSWESKLIISPRLGLRSWIMSKGSSLHCTSPSTSAQPLHHPSTNFYFAMPHSLMAKGIMHSATWGGD